MSSSNALSRHREVLAQTRAAIAHWASEDRPRRHEIAESVFELLLPAQQDTDGESTLDGVSDVLEEYEGVLPHELKRQLVALVSAAHALGRGLGGGVA